MVAIEKKVRKYKEDILTLEEYVQKWEKELIIKEIAQASLKCYEAFTELQMDIAKLEDGGKRKKFDLLCYKQTYDFLVFVENKMNSDLYVLLANNVEPFALLLEHYSLYCYRIENKYDIELDSEKQLRNNNNNSSNSLALESAL